LFTILLSLPGRQKRLSGEELPPWFVKVAYDGRRRQRLVRLADELRTVKEYQDAETPVNREAFIGKIASHHNISRETVLDDLRQLEGGHELVQVRGVERIMRLGIGHLAQLEEVLE